MIKSPTVRSTAPVIPDADNPQDGNFADVIFIFGPNSNRAVVDETVMQCYANGLTHDVLSSPGPTDLEELRRSGRLGPNTHILVAAHGNKTANGHVIEVGPTVMPTIELIAALRRPLDDVAPWKGPLHLLSCYDGLLTDEIKPGSELWDAGPCLAYSGRKPALAEVPAEDIPGAVRFIGQQKALGLSVSAMDSFAHLANWTGECVSIIGGDLGQAVTVHAPKTTEHIMPNALEAEWRGRQTQERLEQKIKSRLKGTDSDVEKLVNSAGKPEIEALDEETRLLKMLHVQADHGKPETLERLLLAHPERLNAKDARGRTLLWRAAGGGNLAVVKLLLKLGADVGATTSNAETALHIAVRSPLADPRVVQLLVNSMGVIDVQNDRGATPLYFAVRARNLELVKILSEAGGNPYIKCVAPDAPEYIKAREDLVPVNLARINGDVAIADAMLAHERRK